MAPALTKSEEPSKLKPTFILQRATWRPPIAVSGEGIYIELEDGRRVIDAVGGAAVACIGNGHPAVKKAIKEQVDKLSYVYNMQLSNQPAEELANYLVNSGNGAFALCGFVSGGSEAMEAIIKLSRQYFYDTKQFQRVNYIGQTVVGATTGVVAPPKGYFKAMKSVCDKYGALFILDEIMSGMGRLGTLHAWEQFADGIAPDLQAIAKGLGGGYASIGAILISQRIADGIRDTSGFWKHGHTYQAHPIATAASLAVQKVITEENLLSNIRTQGALLGSLLNARLLSPNSPLAPYVFDIRGTAGWWAVEFDFDDIANKPAVDLKGDSFAILVQQRCLENGLAIMGFRGGANVEGTRGDHVMFSPAYNVKEEEIEKIVDLFIEGAEEVYREIAV
ncbi:hypothetical protein EUX98_g6496 [Antrodiella citrinella]|uniref:PLP-dependent transferase n=1 Tax=Antrodiella citrinella TaxID=2447956 RepID=A0A4S4MNZ5_9APHY|nr:hypothetical protein EUX98_g6496 [Antrodiella citrinella]